MPRCKKSHLKELQSLSISAQLHLLIPKHRLRPVGVRQMRQKTVNNKRMHYCVCVCVRCGRTLTQAAGGRGTVGVCSLSVLLGSCQWGRQSRTLYCSRALDPVDDPHIDSHGKMADLLEICQRDCHPWVGSGWHWETNTRKRLTVKTCCILPA